MSVQNPERVVTKQDLADFYQGILPYLGGMPDILANKFSKGDMYSTDEKMIGQWIDGKPLYAKTVNFGSLPNQTTKRVASGLTDELVVFIEACAVSSAGSRLIPAVPDPTSAQASFTWGIAMEYDASTHEIIIQCGTDRSSYTGYVLLKYTKTSDSAVSIGNDTDYSTAEKIVGTWIDGRPIWQKTVSGAMPAAGSDTKISVSSDTIDFVLTCKGTVPTYRTQPLSDYLGTSVSTLFLIMTFFDTQEQKVYLRNTGVSAAQGKTAYVTVTYVKTTS